MLRILVCEPPLAALRSFHVLLRDTVIRKAQQNSGSTLATVARPIHSRGKQPNQPRHYDTDEEDQDNKADKKTTTSAVTAALEKDVGRKQKPRKARGRDVILRHLYHIVMQTPRDVAWAAKHWVQWGLSILETLERMDQSWQEPLLASIERRLALSSAVTQAVIDDDEDSDDADASKLKMVTAVCAVIQESLEELNEKSPLHSRMSMRTLRTIDLSFYLYLSIDSSIYLSIDHSISISIYLSITLSIYLSS
jgi:hypothetical protein